MKVTIIPRHDKLGHILNAFKPQLANRFLPEWYKKQNIQWDFWDEPPKAKRCPAIRDYVNDGIIIPAWSDIHFYKREDFSVKWNITVANNPTVAVVSDKMGKFEWIQHQHHQQTTGMELNEVKNYGTLKLICPYYFITEKGYGLEFTDPFYHHRRDIKLLAGRVDTDIWHEVNFPFEFYNDINKYNEHKLKINAGDPLILVRPYKKTDEKISLNVSDYDPEIAAKQEEQSIYYFGIGNDWQRFKKEMTNNNEDN